MTGSIRGWTRKWGFDAYLLKGSETSGKRDKPVRGGLGISRYNRPPRKPGVELDRLGKLR